MEVASPPSSFPYAGQDAHGTLRFEAEKRFEATEPCVEDRDRCRGGRPARARLETDAAREDAPRADRAVARIVRKIRLGAGCLHRRVRRGWPRDVSCHRAWRGERDCLSSAEGRVGDI